MIHLKLLTWVWWPRPIISATWGFKIGESPGQRYPGLRCNFKPSPHNLVRFFTSTERLPSRHRVLSSVPGVNPQTKWLSNIWLSNRFSFTVLINTVNFIKRILTIFRRVYRCFFISFSKHCFQVFNLLWLCYFLEQKLPYPHFVCKPFLWLFRPLISGCSGIFFFFLLSLKRWLTEQIHNSDDHSGVSSGN